MSLSISAILQQVINMKTTLDIGELSELDIACRSKIKQSLDNNEVSDTENIHLQSVIDYLYERINIGNWREVQSYLRKTMTLTSYLKLVAYLKSNNSDAGITESELQQCFNILDYGLLFGCPLASEPKLLQNCATILNDIATKQFPPKTKKLPSSRPVKDAFVRDPNQLRDIDILDTPSMETFYQNYILKEKPAILKNCINHWPAMTKWKDHNYLRKLAGKRTVPIELGAKYTDAEWTLKLMTLEHFITKHIYESNNSTGYLAQYQLFDQIPELKNDIAEPEYCCFSDTELPIDINAWYGPKGTVSPLHHDHKRNLFAQVVGEKQIFLFSPSNSEYLYPHEHELLQNSARVDPREPNLVLHPKYKEAKGYYCVLKPGEMLYIPPKWWHYVVSLSISFSVSFWWT